MPLATGSLGIPAFDERQADRSMPGKNLRARQPHGCQLLSIADVFEWIGSEHKEVRTSTRFQNPKLIRRT